MLLTAVIILFLVGAVFSGYLLFKNSIKPYGFCAILFTFFVISALTYRLDDIIGVSYKGAEIKLREIQNEAYATISAVRKVGKLNLKLAADLAVRLGYAGSAFELEDLNRYQKDIAASLDSLRVPIEEKQEILEIIGSKIRRQLAYDGVGRKVIHFVNNDRSYSSEDRHRITRTLNELFENYEIGKTRQEILNFLKNENLPTDSTVAQGLDRFDYYIKNGELLAL